MPEVDPDHLMRAYAIIMDWAGSEDDGVDCSCEGADLFELLDNLKRKLNVEPSVAVALFKRSLALVSYCAVAPVPEIMIDNGKPDRRLLVAASTAQVRHQAERDANCLTPYFDEAEMQTAYRSALN